MNGRKQRGGLTMRTSLIRSLFRIQTTATCQVQLPTAAHKDVLKPAVVVCLLTTRCNDR